MSLPLIPEFGLVVVGDEILSGKRADKHMPRLIELLSERGLLLSWADYVGDSPERITATLARAFDSGAVVFCCGGIGATPDDHTRQCAARALGLPLVLHPGAEALIRERMQDTAREQGTAYEPDRPDNVHRLNMGVFPEGAQLIPNPYNKIPGFFCVGKMPGASAPSQVVGASAPDSEPSGAGERGCVYFVPGFPVMAWPMMAWVLDQRYSHLFWQQGYVEMSVIVFGAMEASLTPLMLEIERDHAAVKVFSLPSVDHPQYGRHIDLGVKGEPERVRPAYRQLVEGLKKLGAALGPELVRP